jgi:hypothetical protein
MSDVLPVVKKKSPLRLVVVVIGALVVFSVLAYLLVSFRSNIADIFTKESSVALDPADEMNKMSESTKTPFAYGDEPEVPVVSGTEDAVCNHYSCVDLSDSKVTLNQIASCASRYSEINPPEKTYVENGLSVTGVISSVDTVDATVVFSNGSTIDMSDVSQIYINGRAPNMDLGGSLKLAFDIKEILSVLEVGTILTLVSNADSVADTLYIYCYEK